MTKLIDPRDPRDRTFAEGIMAGIPIPEAYKSAGFDEASDPPPYELANSPRIMIHVGYSPVPEEKLPCFIESNLYLVYFKAAESGDYATALDALKTIGAIRGVAALQSNTIWSSLLPKNMFSGSEDDSGVH